MHFTAVFGAGPHPLASHLHLHRVRVHLTHVQAAVFHFDAANDQRPGVEIAVRHRQPIVVRDDVLVNGQNRFGVRFDPGHLFPQIDRRADIGRCWFRG